ncbi:MAG: hypothetical protein CMM08_09900, partial [Rhodospirillaceae bacterium]|nr:hypothetical protein [Rhodospirillaceae bacterium]
MSDGGDQRRLSAILAADVVGYTRRMEQDAEGTVAAWKAARSDVIDPTISGHAGRIVKHTGDGFLAEFPTVQAAVECAVAMQDRLAAGRLDFRMGVDLGDIIDDGEDVHGEGVNIAARIESLAEPGGICISGGVYEQVRNRLPQRFEGMGEVEVKNVSNAVRVYRVLPSDQSTETTRRAHAGKRPALAAAAIVLAVIVGTGAWWWQSRAPDLSPADPAKLTYELGEKPSIAVLPFANLSTDKEQEFFAEGISEDLTTQLSKLSGLLVISRTSTFKYKGKNVDIREIARDLGVRFVLEGSVRRGGDQLRVNAQLIDATSGGHIWAETYNGAVGDVFALQDRINQNIVKALRVQLVGEERDRIADRGTENVEAYEAFMRGERLRNYSKATVWIEAINEYEKAIALDPKFGAAHAGLGHVLFTQSIFGQPAVNQTETWARSKVLADRSIRLGDAPLGHLLRATISLLRNQDHDRAMSEARRAVALDPNFAEGYATLAEVMLYSGQIDESLESLDQATRLNPGFPERYRFLMGQAKFHQRKYQAALEDMENFCKTAFSWQYQRSCAYYQASALAHIGNIAKAKLLIKTATNARIASISTMISLGYPFKDRVHREQLDLPPRFVPYPMLVCLPSVLRPGSAAAHQ